MRAAGQEGEERGRAQGAHGDQQSQEGLAALPAARPRPQGAPPAPHRLLSGPFRFRVASWNEGAVASQLCFG